MIRLPDEVLYGIFSHFQFAIPDVKWTLLRDRINHDPIRILLNLSLVCRQFYSVAQCLLYRIIVSGIRDDEHERQALLARAFATHPQLGLNVRAIVMDDTAWPGDAASSNLLEERLGSLNMPQAFQRRWDKKTQSASINMTPRNRNNLTAFILTLTPYVKLVDITYSCPSQAMFWLLGGSLGKRKEIASTDSSDVCDNEEGHPPYGNVTESHANHLPNLQELRLRGADYNSAIEPSPPITDFRLALLHPCLRTLRVQGFHWLSLEKETRLWASFPIRVQRLDISEAIIDAAAIRHILTICKDLRSLHISLGSVRKSGSDVNWEFDLTRIGYALRDLGRNLVEFGLQTEGFEEHRHCEGRLGSLQNLTNLKQLWITKENLVGVHGREDTLLLNEALPFSLETLCLYSEYYLSPEADYPDVYQEVNDEVCGVLVGGEFPELRAVTILRFCVEEKLKGGEFGGAVEGWDLLETILLEKGNNPKRLMHLNTYLTRKPEYRLDAADEA